ncbi:uncharacterized protein OCT59_026227 [Rhizophagus irregularis]|uniref:uncharacterized protein n=1 Tax=Rhizophagus irregularis TaxID=588596 RepID=UPI0033194F68|nr:hypothetical protein OCT59_026227 [Rhizophagus irregularis]
MSEVISKIPNKLELPEEELGDELLEEPRELVSDSLVELASDSLDTLLKSSSRALFFFSASMIIIDSAELCSEMASFRFPMVTIPTNIAGLTNKKTAVKTKNGMLPEELSNDKLDMIR